MNLKAELGSTPVTTLSVVADLVVQLHPGPLRDGTVLFHLLGQFQLNTKRLMGSHFATLVEVNQAILAQKL